MRILGFAAQILVNFFKCLRVLTLLDQTLNFRKIVCKDRAGNANSEADSQCTPCLEERKAGLERGVQIHGYVILRLVI